MEENVRIWIPHFQQRRYCIFKSDFKIIGVEWLFTLWRSLPRILWYNSFLQHRKFWRSNQSSLASHRASFSPSLPLHIPLYVLTSSWHSLTSCTSGLIAINSGTTEPPRKFATGSTVGKDKVSSALFLLRIHSLVLLKEVLSLKPHSNLIVFVIFRSPSWII